MVNYGESWVKNYYHIYVQSYNIFIIVVIAQFYT